jgi:transcriptional regulator with XRE-family HTH domain
MKNISQRQLAESLGISLRAYKYYEAGEREPTVSVLIALADYFSVSLDYLVGRSDDPERR